MSTIAELRDELASLRMEHEHLKRASARFSDNTVRLYGLSPKVYAPGDAMISAITTSRTWTDRETGVDREIAMNFGATRTFAGYGANSAICFVAENKSPWRVTNFVPYIRKET